LREGLLTEWLGFHLRYSEQFREVFVPQVRLWTVLLMALAVCVGLGFLYRTWILWRARLRSFDARRARGFRSMAARHAVLAGLFMFGLAWLPFALSEPWRAIPIPALILFALGSGAVAALQHVCGGLGIRQTRRLYRGK